MMTKRSKASRAKAANDKQVGIDARNEQAACDRQAADDLVKAEAEKVAADAARTAKTKKPPTFFERLFG